MDNTAKQLEAVQQQNREIKSILIVLFLMICGGSSLYAFAQAALLVGVVLGAIGLGCYGLYLLFYTTQGKPRALTRALAWADTRNLIFPAIVITFYSCIAYAVYATAQEKAARQQGIEQTGR